MRLLGVAWLLGMTAPASADFYLNGDNSKTLLRYDNDGKYLETLLDYRDGDGGGFVGLTRGPDGALYVARGADNLILKYDLSTRTATTFASTKVDRPHGLTFGGPDNDLFVANFDARSIDRYSGKTGAFKNTVATVSGSTVGVAVDQQGNIYFSIRGSNVYKYDGIALTTFASGVSAEGIYLAPDNNLYVGSLGSGAIMRYKLDGTPWGAGGNTTDPTFSSGLVPAYPTGITSGPDGNLYVSDYIRKRVLRYDGTTGVFLDVFATMPAGITSGAWGISFAAAPVPEPSTYALMLVGLGIIGFFGRRQRHRAHWSEMWP